MVNGVAHIYNRRFATQTSPALHEVAIGNEGDSVCNVEVDMEGEKLRQQIKEGGWLEYSIQRVNLVALGTSD